MEKKMNLKKTTLVIAFAMITVLATGSNTAFGQEAENDRSIVGAWRTVVTPRNCTTNAPAPVVIRGLFTFNTGGTMAEYGIVPGVGSPARRSPGHGVWDRERGWQNYTIAFFMLRYDATGALIGSQRIRAALVMDESGDTFTTSSTVETLDPDDNVLSVSCATAVGTRFQ